MSSLGTDLRQTVSDNQLRPKEEASQAVVHYLKHTLELAKRPETTLNMKIDGNQLLVEVRDPTAQEVITVTGAFGDKDKHDFSFSLDGREVGLFKVRMLDSDLGGPYLQAQPYLKRRVLDRSLNRDEFRTLVADALGAPAPAPHQVEIRERPQLESLDSTPPALEADSAPRPPLGL